MKLSKAEQVRVDECCDERNGMTGGGFFVYLRYGWRLDDAHCFGEDSERAVHATLRDVVPCDCAECAAELARAS